MIGRVLAAVAVRGGGLGVQLLLNIALGRLIGAQGMGVYGFYTAATNTLGDLGALGLPTRVMRDVAQAEADGGRQRARDLVGGALRWALAATVTVGAVLTLALALGPVAFAANPFLTVAPWVAAAAVAFVALRLFAEAIKGAGHSNVAVALESLGVPVGMAVGVGLAVGLAAAGRVPALSTTGVIAVNVCALVGTALLLRWYWRRITGCPPAGTPARDTVVRGTGLLPFWGLAILGVLAGNLPILLAPLVASPEDVGRFTVAFRLLGLVTAVLITLGAWFGPRFAVAARDRDSRRLRRLLLASQGLSLLIGLPFLVLCLTHPALILGAFGPEFPAGAAVLQVMALGHVVNAATGLPGYLLNMAGFERLELTINLVALMTLGVGIALLGPSGGAVGLAWAVTLSVVLKQVLSWTAAIRACDQLERP